MGATAGETEASLSENIFNQALDEFSSTIKSAISAVIPYPDSQDVFSDTLLSIWTASRSFAGRSSLKTFTYTITRRRIKDYFRQTYHDRLLNERLAAALREDRPLGNTVREITQEKILFLTPAEIRILRATAGGFSPTEISRRLGISKNTVRSHFKGIHRKTGIKSYYDLRLRSISIVGMIDERSRKAFRDLGL